jgi:hypothetical protein
MELTEFRAYDLSKIITKDFDNLCDFILEKEMKINMGYSDYIIIDLEEIIEAIGILIDCNHRHAIKAPFDIHEIMNILSKFAEGKIGITHVFISQ